MRTLLSPTVLLLIAVTLCTSRAFAQQQGVVIGDATATPQATLDVRGDARIGTAPADNAQTNFLMRDPLTGDVRTLDPSAFPTASGNLTWNGSAWVFSDNSWGNQVAQTDFPLTGDGKANNPITFEDGTDPDGNQVWKWDGTEWVLAADAGTVYTPSTGIDITGNVITNTAPDQTITITGDPNISVGGPGYPDFTLTYTGPLGDLTEVTVSNGLIVTNGTGPIPDIGLPAGSPGNEALVWDGNNWVPGPPLGDDWGADVVNHEANSPISGDGTLVNPLAFIDGMANGHVLTWDGNNWVSQAAPGGADDWGADVVNHEANSPISGDGTPVNPIAFIDGMANGHVLTWDGNNWVSQAAPGGADDWGVQVVVSNTTTFVGDGTAANPLDLADGGAIGHVLTWDGTNWVSQAAPSGADDWGTQVAQTDATIDGDGTGANPLEIAQQGATNGQVLKWDGATWSPADDEGTTYTSGGPGLDITGAVITNTAPDQIVSLTSTTGLVTGGTYPNLTVDLPVGIVDDHILQWNAGTGTWESQPSPSGADNWGSAFVNHEANSPVSGQGTPGDPLAFIDGAANGHVLTWDGTNWISQAPGSGADNWGTQVAVTSGFITGDGTGADAIRLSPGTTDNDVLTWNAGTGQWESQAVPETDYTGLGEVNVNTITNEISLNTGDVTTSSSAITLGGSPTGAAVGSGFSIDIAFNAAGQDGILPAPTGNNRVWSTDGAGIPDWRPLPAGASGITEIIAGDGLGGAALTGPTATLDVQANNGLEIVADNVGLGGALIRDTEIDLDNNGLFFTGGGTSDEIGLFTNTVSANGNILRYVSPYNSTDWQIQYENNDPTNGALIRCQNTAANNGDRVTLGSSQYTGTFWNASAFTGVHLPTLGATDAIFGATNSADGTGLRGSWPGAGLGWAVFADGDAGGTSAWFNISDRRLKRDIVDLQNGLQTIMQLRPRTYYFDTETHPKFTLPNEKQYGFIAQELEQSIPEAVSEKYLKGRERLITDDQQVKAINKQVKAVQTTTVIPFLVKAVQEQQALIEKMDKRIVELEAELKTLKNK